MKKKIVALCLCVALAVIAIGGATLAYFTDTQSETNTFTVGNVKIKLIEQERDGNGGLKDFEDGKVLMPIVGSAQGPKDAYGMPVAKNYVDKIITVENLASDAYVRVYYAIPAALDSTEAKYNIIHYNAGNRFMPKADYVDVTNDTNADHEANMGNETYVGTAVIDGVKYCVYYKNYNKILSKNEVTGSAFMTGVYLDKDLEFDGTNYTITRNGKTESIAYDFSKGVKIPVLAAGVQADGFDTADDAFTAAFGAKYNPWATTATTGE